jgi:hypothetical protein
MASEFLRTQGCEMVALTVTLGQLCAKAIWFGRLAVFATVSASRHRSTDLILYVFKKYNNITTNHAWY